MPTFFIILFCIYLSGNVYIFIRGWQALSHLPGLITIPLAIIFWIFALCFFAIFLFRDSNLPLGLGHFMHEIGTGWLVFAFYMIVLLLIIDILRLLHIQFPYSFFIALGLVVCTLIYGFIHYKHPATEVINIVINKPSINHQQLKMVGISDIHLGYGTTKKDLQRYVDKINEQQPDLIIIGGDLIDNSITPIRRQRMEEELSQLKAPLGIYMVPGNHEYISGINSCIDFIHETPIQLLKDSVVVLPNGLQIVGRDDRMNPNRMSLSSLTKQVDAGKPSILLDHQPYDLEDTVKAGIDLQFSGHTHRGQVWPISLLTDRIFELSYGYMEKGKSKFYVSSGLSLWGPPFRIGTQSEMVIFNITFD